ncbi:MAG TPA: UDP-N-acetylglucosamine 2-epimerase (non-hydrolyzing), partial [Longimicrobiales bacterium]
MKILAVVGARPNFVKIAPLMAEMRQHPELQPMLVHTGQHYDQALSTLFFEELAIAEPDLKLAVGSGSHATQTAQAMVELERAAAELAPDLILVVGDVNSTLAAALVAAKACIPLAHVEAGLRSGDRTMPEEVNRVVTDALSDLLFTTEAAAAENLAREGVPPTKIHFAGNVMVDTLLRFLPRARALCPPERVGLQREGYAVVTLHRPSNVDRPEVLQGILHALAEIGTRLDVVFPVHPRTRAQLEEVAAGMPLGVSRLRLTEPLGYLEFLGLVDGARLVLTDSGGLQEETTALGVPCLTLRENTERPATIELGTNRLVGTDPAAILPAVSEVLEQPPRPPVEEVCRPPLWDGRAAQRIVATLRRLAAAACILGLLAGAGRAR